MLKHQCVAINVCYSQEDDPSKPDLAQFAMSMTDACLANNFRAKHHKLAFSQQCMDPAEFPPEAGKVLEAA